MASNANRSHLIEYVHFFFLKIWIHSYQLQSKYNDIIKTKEKILSQKNILKKKCEDQIIYYQKLTLNYGEIKKLKQSLDILSSSKLMKMNKDIEEKDEKTKSFSKILEDKFHTLQTYKNIMITFHQQLDSESKKTDSKRFAF